MSVPPVPPVRMEPESNLPDVRLTLGRIAGAIPRPRLDVGSALVASGVVLVVVAAALVYVPFGIALLGLALVAAGIGVMRA